MDRIAAFKMRTFPEIGLSGVWNKQTILVRVWEGGGWRARPPESHGDSPFLYCLHHTPNTVHCLRQSLKRLYLFSTLFDLIYLYSNQYCGSDLFGSPGFRFESFIHRKTPVIIIFSRNKIVYNSVS